MSKRRSTSPRRGATAAALTTALVLAASGCAGGGSPPSGGTRPAGGAHSDGSGSSGDGADGGHKPLAHVRGGKDGKLTLNVTSVVRSTSGFTTVKGTLRNDGPSVSVLPGWASDEAELKDNGLSMAGATLVDEKARKRYLILRDTRGRCLCTRFTGGFQEGESTEWYAQFPAPPASTTRVDFQVADLPSASVPLSGE